MKKTKLRLLSTLIIITLALSAGGGPVFATGYGRATREIDYHAPSDEAEENASDVASGAEVGNAASEESGADASEGSDGREDKTEGSGADAGGAEEDKTGEDGEEDSAEPVSYDEPEKNGKVYVIETASELMWFKEHVNGGNYSACAELAADIDMSEYAWDGIGRERFSGTFNGKGYTIRNLSGTEGLVGLNEGVVKNLRLLSVSVDRGGNNIGAIAGVNTGTVSCCFVGGSVGGPASGLRVGGIAGLNEGKITGCITDCAVTGDTTGGLVGVNGGEGSFDGCLYFGSSPKLEGEDDDERGHVSDVFSLTENGVVIDYASSAAVSEQYAVDAVNRALSACDGTFELTEDFLGSLEGTAEDDAPRYYYYTCAGVRVETDDPALDGVREEHSGGQAGYTQKARCERCGAEYGELLPDTTAPEISIVFGDKSYTGLDTLPAPVCFSEGECVFRIDTSDVGLGVGEALYLLSERPLEAEALGSAEGWSPLPGGGSVKTGKDKSGYLYVRAVDLAGNSARAGVGYLSDSACPVISGAVDGEYLSESAKLSVSDDNLTVTLGESVFPELAVKAAVNGIPAALDENGVLSLAGYSGPCEITAVDCAGNTAALKVNVIAGDYVVKSYKGSGGAVTVTVTRPTGELVKNMVVNADGSSVTTDYGADGVTETALDSAGKPTKIYFTANDGTVTATQYQADGSSSVSRTSPSGKVLYYSATSADGITTKTEYLDDGATVVTKTSAGGSVIEHTTHYADGSFKTDGFIPIMVTGSGAKYTGGTMSFRSDDEYVNFLRVTVNGDTLAESLYTVHKGSIVVTLSEGYLKTLAPGSYTLGIVSTNGSAMGIFTIPEPEPADSAQQDEKPLGDASSSTNAGSSGSSPSGSTGSSGGGRADSFLSSTIPESTGVGFISGQTGYSSGTHGSALTRSSGFSGVIAAIVAGAVVLIAAVFAVSLILSRRDDDDYDDDDDYAFEYEDDEE